VLILILALEIALLTGSAKPLILEIFLLALQSFLKQYQLNQKMALSLGWIKIAKVS
jgi:hypothetical protein